eukprot:m.195480 g.195480  ORF g.195480 m.195480 type:complete len:58 (-) comp15231_c0_seq2:1074-1247(-)
MHPMMTRKQGRVTPTTTLKRLHDRQGPVTRHLVRLDEMSTDRLWLVSFFNDTLCIFT